MRAFKEIYRLVITGITAGPAKMAAEYTVLDGEFTEGGKRKKFTGTDFDQTLGELWNSSIAAVQAEEKL